MHFVFRFLPRHLLRRGHHHLLQRRSVFDATSSIHWVRDRGLDHAVERERNLKPLLNIKNLIKSEPSKSLPLSAVAASKDSLQIPFRPIEFIRHYSSVFEEFFPGGVAIHPHIKLTPESINLDAEEQLIYQSVSYRESIADRLLKLLMIGRTHKVPISVIDRLKWDLGLPQDYVKSIVPEFPDYFQVTKGSEGKGEPILELVCWTDELAVSVLESKAQKISGSPVRFSMEYSKGFDMDKNYKKWVDEWQKLPYVSPYENAFHLPSTSIEFDKWAVAILHEILNLFISKKTEKESILFLGEFLGLRARFKRAMLQHPGIFYVSSKNRTHTVVLRDGYKRGTLNERNPLMDIRFKYVRLMNTVEEKSKPNKQTPHSKETEVEKLKEDGYTDEEMYESPVEDSDDEGRDEAAKQMKGDTRKENLEKRRTRQQVSMAAGPRTTDHNWSRSSRRKEVQSRRRTQMIFGGVIRS